MMNKPKYTLSPLKYLSGLNIRIKTLVLPVTLRGQEVKQRHHTRAHIYPDTGVIIATTNMPLGSQLAAFPESLGFPHQRFVFPLVRYISFVINPALSGHCYCVQSEDVPAMENILLKHSESDHTDSSFIVCSVLRVLLERRQELNLYLFKEF